LPQQPEQFLGRLTALTRGHAYLLPQDRSCVQAWRDVVNGLETIATTAETKKGMFGGKEGNGDAAADGVLRSLSRACGWPRVRPWNAEMLGCLRDLSVHAAPENAVGWDRVRRALWPGQIRTLDDAELIAFLNHEGADVWLKLYPHEDETFADRLQALLATMPDVPQDIEQRAHALAVGRGYVPRQAVQIQAWERAMFSLGELRTLRRDYGPDQLKGKQVLAYAESLGKELAIALREKVWINGSAILNPEVIQQIGRVVIGDDTLYQASVVHKAWYEAFLKGHRGG
ncbi:MAG TPA: hypothetical protein VHB77_12135, partial [Planctomycetaceae bacterium]|nr:hypothetical protein [Planctomycetaceae bacterium]